jgi:hypothetical protein
VSNWCWDAPFKVARDENVLWDATRGFQRGTAADVAKLLGEPDRFEADHLVWAYGETRIKFNEQGRVAQITGAKYLKWLQSSTLWTLVGKPDASPVPQDMAHPAARPSVAENGSYYGEISADTGLPKTVYTPGYVRQDGVYIPSHYREAPGPRGSVISGRSGGLGVVENGSYYGQISEATGRPKTVHVGGYFRKDGTYVRGHYRSKPRR